MLAEQQPQVENDQPGVEPTDEVSLSKHASVKEWQQRILSAKAHWKDDFDRMRTCMEFVQGFQWNNQQKQMEQKYVANFLLRLIKQKVATLYAKDPKTEFVRRKRMDFSIWDEKVETLLQTIQEAQMIVMAGGMVPPQSMMILDDYMSGKEWQDLVKKVGQTLECLYQYQIDTQEPEFKLQAKDAVDRGCVCGVAYARVNYCASTEGYNEALIQSATYSSTYEQKQKAVFILKQVDEGKVQMDQAEVETLRSLVASIGASSSNAGEEPAERIVFDFPPATSIIPDPSCRRLKGFVGAQYIIEEYCLPIKFIQAFFDVPTDLACDIKKYEEENNSQLPPRSDTSAGGADASSASLLPEKSKAMVWEVFDINTKNRFIVCDGYKDFLLEPEPQEMVGKMFWPIFALVFNEVETESNCKATIYPPSDVSLGMHQQREWNRTREGLRGQRKANAPKYLYAKGLIEPDDVKKIANAEANECIPVSVPAGMKLSDMMAPMQVAAIDAAVYDTNPLKEDLLLATGIQEANIGPAQPNVTATNSSIAEQSRGVVAASDVDTLDDWLSALAAYSGGLLMKHMPRETVVQIVGRGAVWPEQSRDVFSNEIVLTAVAGSSGRANKQLEIHNFTILAPILQQAGANPQAIIREGIRIFDANIDPVDFFPVPLDTNAGAAMPQQQGGQSGEPGSGAQPPAQQGKGSSVNGRNGQSGGKGQTRPAPTANTEQEPVAA